MDATRFNMIGPIPYSSPVVLTGLSPGQRLQELQQTAQVQTQNLYGPGSIDERNIPVARESLRYGLNPFVKAQTNPIDKVKSPIKETFNTSNISFTNIDRIKENFAAGLSPRPFGPLGENAINGTVGGKLNLKA